MSKASRLFLALVVSVAALALMSGCSKQAKLERHLSRANAYFDGKEFKKAEVEYLNVIRLQPTNYAAIRRLATIYYDRGQGARSLPFWQGAAALNTNDLEARIKLAGLMAVGQSQTAREHALYVLDRQPTNSDAILLLSDSARNPKDIAEAQKRLLQLPAHATNGAPFHLALSGLYLRQTNLPAAEGELRRAVALEPESPLVQRSWANWLWRQGDITNADQAFKKVVASESASLSSQMQYADFKLRTGALEEAKDRLLQITKRAPDYSEPWLRLARIAFFEQKHQECADFLKKAEELDPQNDETDLWQARLKQVQGKAEEAVKALEQLQQDYPGVPEVCYQLATAYLQVQEPQKAAASLRQAITARPAFTAAVLLLAELNLRLGDSDAAILSLQELIRRQPNVDRAYFLLATAYGAQGRHEDAYAVFAGLEKRFPTNGGIAYVKGIALRQMNRNDEARRAFEKALTLISNDQPVIVELVNLDLREKNLRSAAQRVQQLLAKNPKSAEAKVLEAKVLIAQTNWTAAEAALQSAIELDPGAGPAYGMLSEIYLATKRMPQAIRQLEKAVAQNPRQVNAFMILASIYEFTGELEKAVKNYQEVLKLNPKSVPALNNLACLLGDSPGMLEKAYTHATKARELAPDNAAVADTLGWILFRRRDYGRALALLQEAASRSPDQAEIQFHLGMSHYMLGQEQPARSALQRALQLNPKLPTKAEVQARLEILGMDVGKADQAAMAKLQEHLRRYSDDLPALLRLAAIHERTGAPDKARQVLDDARKAAPSSAQVSLRLAQLYAGSLRDPKQAMALARETRKLAPQDTQLALALGRIAYESGDIPWAWSLLQESAQQQPNDPEILFDLAHAQHAMSRVAESSETMQRALKIHPSFPRAADAQWFISLLDLTASPAKRLESEAQVQQLLKARPDYLPALMVVGLIHEQRGRFAEARQAYERMLARAPQFAPASKRLAVLFTDQFNDQQKAWDFATKAKQALGQDTELSTILGKIAYRRGDYRSALRFLQEGNQGQPDDAERLFFQGMAHFGLKDTNASKKALGRALTLSPDAPFAAEAKKTLTALK